MYVVTKGKSRKSLFIIHWKELGALERPNGILLNSNKPKDRRQSFADCSHALASAKIRNVSQGGKRWWILKVGLGLHLLREGGMHPILFSCSRHDNRHTVSTHPMSFLRYSWCHPRAVAFFNNTLGKHVVQLFSDFILEVGWITPGGHTHRRAFCWDVVVCYCGRARRGSKQICILLY